MSRKNFICEYLNSSSFTKIWYLRIMADMGYGLNRETVMTIAYGSAEKLKKPHPFSEETAGVLGLRTFGITTHKNTSSTFV